MAKVGELELEDENGNTHSIGLREENDLNNAAFAVQIDGTTTGYLDVVPPSEGKIPVELRGPSGQVKSLSDITFNLYSVGGIDENGNATNETYEFDPEQNSWTNIDNYTSVTSGNLNSARDSAATTTVNNKIITFGGYNGTNNVDTYESFDGVSWSESQQLDSSQTKGSSGVASLGSTFYVLKGAEFGQDSNNNYEYFPTDEIYEVDTSTASLTQVSQDPNNISANYLAAAADESRSKIYMTGGYDENDNSLSYATTYDPSLPGWSKLPDMPRARGGHGAVISGDSLYVVAGNTADFRSANLTSAVDRLDLNNETWSGNIGDSSNFTGRRFTKAVIIQNEIFVVGGRTGTSVSSTISSNEAFDLDSLSWSSYSNLPDNLSAVGLARLDSTIIS